MKNMIDPKWIGVFSTLIILLSGSVTYVHSLNSDLYENITKQTDKKIEKVEDQIIKVDDKKVSKESFQIIIQQLTRIEKRLDKIKTN